MGALVGRAVVVDFGCGFAVVLGYGAGAVLVVAAGGAVAILALVPLSRRLELHVSNPSSKS